VEQWGYTAALWNYGFVRLSRTVDRYCSCTALWVYELLFLFLVSVVLSNGFDAASNLFLMENAEMKVKGPLSVFLYASLDAEPQTDRPENCLIWHCFVCAADTLLVMGAVI
jgi:hypothetical protein